ncbi:MAG: ABC-2 family transporter protein [Planctomycetota bacterium]
MVDSFWYHFRMFFHYFFQFLKVRLTYKLDFFLYSFTILLSNVTNLAFVWLIFEHFPHLNGWRLDEVVLIYAFSLVPFSFFNVVSWNLYRFGETQIIEGNFDRILLRPINTLFQILCESARLESLNDAILGVILIIICTKRLQITVGPYEIILMICCFGGATLIFFSVFLLLTAINFWAEDRVGISAPVYNMIKFGHYPISIYHPVLRFLLTTLIPFAFVGFYPTATFLHKEEFLWWGWLTPVLGIVWFGTAYWVWNLGVRNYKSTGH